MKVLLKENVKGLGTIGNVVNVANGYGRNYLIPRNLAVEANPRNVRKFEHDKKLILEKAKKIKNSQEEISGELSSMTFSIEANAGDDGKLFGSVTNKDIADVIQKHGIEVDKRKVVLPEDTIKRLGTYAVQIKLHPEVTTTVNIEVVPVQKTGSSSE
jgi:large subunit ribosomal protein L9